MTLEASLTLPAVLLVLLSVVQLFSAVTFQARLFGAMEQVGRRMSYYYYAVEELTDQEKEASSALLKSLAVTAFSETAAKGLILEELKSASGSDFFLEGGLNGISFLLSHYDSGDETIHLSASYRLRFPFLAGITIPIRQTSAHRVWTGNPMPEYEEEEIVYVAETGQVYHTALSCTHLSIKISESKFSAVERLRNAEGAKYYPCEICGNSGGETVYVTTYGTRYHFNKNCSGLKRTVKSVPISEAGGLPLCKRCAKRSGQ